MRPSRLNKILQHNGRLNVLCCLLDDGPLMASQLTAGIGESLGAVRYWLGLLESFCLVEKLVNPGGGEPLYVATLDEQPEWVREAVEDHRARRRPDFG